jgi:hypothetical protein
MLDLEAAAMLMTSFSHKAVAVASGALHNDEGSIPEYSPDRSSVLDPGDYLTGPSGIPQMPWDFMPTTAPDEKAHSVTSSVSSQDNSSQQPFVHMGSIQPAQSQLGNIMERQDSLGVSMPTAFPTLTDTFAAGSPTAHALSPFPSMTGPVSPVNYRRSPGPSQALTLPKAPQLPSDQQRATIASKLEEGMTLPATASINLYLSTYFNLFHHHMPFLHPVSFQPETAEPALLLAVLSIGALYNFEQDQAFNLHHASKKLVGVFLSKRHDFDSRKCPLWCMQSTLLNMLFESWSGGSQGLEWACSMKSLLANVSLLHSFTCCY